MNLDKHTMPETMASTSYICNEAASFWQAFKLYNEVVAGTWGVEMLQKYGYTNTMLLVFWGLGCLLAHGATVREERSLMGSPFQVTVVHEDEAFAQEAVNIAFLEMARLEALISSWRASSQTSQVNRSAGIAAVPVDPELFRLVKRALKVSKLTDGAFDITFASAGNLWDFKTGVIPAEADLKKAVAAIDFRNVVLNETQQSIFLKETGTRIGFGAIGKGFAANRAITLLKKLGVAHALINAGGDMVATGKQEDGKPWQIGIAHPRKKGKLLAHLSLTEQAVVTSGDYERFFTRDGKRYSHIIDPRTGYPVAGMASVTIICPDGELADALATSVFVLGQEPGLALVNRLKGVECILVNGQGEVFYSKNIQHQLAFVKDTKVGE